MVCIPGAANELPGSNVQCETMQVRRCLSVAGVDVVPVPPLGFTSGSIAFAGATGELAQDNPNLFWDDVNNRGGIGTNAPIVAYELTVRNPRAAEAVIAVQNSNALGFSFLNFFDELGALTLGIGHSNVDNTNGIDLVGRTLQLVSNGGGTDKFHFLPQGSMEFWTAVAPTVSAATRAKLAVIGNALNLSNNGGAYSPITTTAGLTFTAGSLLFAGAGGAPTVDNANLFFDDTTNQLGVGTNAIVNAYRMAIFGRALSGGSCLLMRAFDTASYAAFDAYDSAGTFKGAFGYAGSTNAIAHAQDKNFFYTGGPDFVFANATGNEHVIGMTNGAAFHQLDDGAAAAVGAAGTGRIRYNAALNIMQVSLNGAAYVPL